MRVFGIDFSSAPSTQKPITCAMCRLEADALVLDGLCEFDVIDSFKNFLAADGPWIAGIDFPFGLPREFLAPVNWQAEWSSYVSRAAAMDRTAFRELVRSVCSSSRAGQRYLKRKTDQLAAAQSPMNVVRPPVGLMFHTGAPALLSSGVSVLPMRHADRKRIVVDEHPFTPTA